LEPASQGKKILGAGEDSCCPCIADVR